MVRYGMDSFGSEYGSTAVSWEHDTETSGSIKCRECFTV